MAELFLEMKVRTILVKTLHLIQFEFGGVGGNTQVVRGEYSDGCFQSLSLLMHFFTWPI